jgi:hypothetical protein
VYGSEACVTKVKNTKRLKKIEKMKIIWNLMDVWALKDKKQSAEFSERMGYISCVSGEARQAGMVWIRGTK